MGGCEIHILQTQSKPIALSMSESTLFSFIVRRIMA